MHLSFVNTISLFPIFIFSSYLLPVNFPNGRIRFKSILWICLSLCRVYSRCAFSDSFHHSVILLLHTDTQNVTFQCIQNSEAHSWLDWRALRTTEPKYKGMCNVQWPSLDTCQMWQEALIQGIAHELWMLQRNGSLNAWKRRWIWND